METPDRSLPPPPRKPAPAWVRIGAVAMMGILGGAVILGMFLY
ncbi:MAG: hypothetical protein QNJ71_08860 [Acidimicrobiia bacterium]|nr:hypothetical protein [Acidimicrobiia bacterium]